MAIEEKKFLDDSGVTHLWERIEEKFPNSEELALVIEAIDEVKADKEDLNTLTEKVNEVEAIANTQVDYNQNDETAIDYVKNRTHWSEVGLVEVLPETTVSVNEYVELANNIILKVGKIYNVVFNDTAYDCVAWSNGEAVVIGNGSIYGGNDVSTGNVGGNGESFSCDSYNNGTCYLNVSESGTYTIKISYQDEVIHKIDKKYLPEIQNISLPRNYFSLIDLDNGYTYIV